MQRGIFLLVVVQLFLGVSFAEEKRSPFLQKSPLGVFDEISKVMMEGRRPIVFLDIDDTLIRTAFRYLDVIEAINLKYEIFPPWSKPLTEDWTASHHMRPKDIYYLDSFEKTLRETLERLITGNKEKLNKMYTPDEKGVPDVLSIFYKVFFDPNNVSKDTMFLGSALYLNNLLSLMKAVNGKVVFLSGRADKYLDVTKKSLEYNGVISELLTGEHVLWYLKPSSGKINFQEDVFLDFRNDKAGMVSSILEMDSNFKVAGFLDNEARNIFSLVGHKDISGGNLYFFRSADATWASTSDGEIVDGFLNKIKNESNSFFVQFEKYETSQSQEKWLHNLMGIFGATYYNAESMEKLHGINMECKQALLPVEPKVRQLSWDNERDLEIIRDIIIP